ncbi:TetR/AcrR family transcriptional regulator [Comamonas composti]|uniref:TetR/AcrR family transcriptional regulator n=1 Tax=Comamonas composti TaxID=408558 RepID=UPI00041D2757|nr:TetR/AcrR family transcriptional regulator [Comamonas composti]
MHASKPTTSSFPRIKSPQPEAAALEKRPRGRPRKTDSEIDEGNRRRQLIEGAARLFHAKGYDATSTRDIAAAAGMRSGSPFYFFESKSQLLQVVMQQGMSQALQSQTAAMAALPEDCSASEQLRALIDHHFRVLLEPQAHFIPLMVSEWRSLTPEQRIDVGRIKDEYEGCWQPVLQILHEEGRLRADPHVARMFIFGALNWSVQWFKPQGPKSVEALVDEAMALFL